MDRGRETRAGDRLGGFAIEGTLGRGGMGVVYRATQVRLGRAVALKVITPSLAEDPRFRERFEREAALAAAIEHPHVLPVYEAGEDSGRLYMAMRLVEGDDLAELLRRTGPFSAVRAVRLVGQVAAALDAAHRAGLVHRDVKPANVLVAGGVDDEHSFLTDFGLTKRSSSQSGVTGPGQWLGTLDYVAPEQIRGDPVDSRADVYALGCVLYELLTGRKPFSRDSDVATMWAHISDDPPVPSAVDPTLPIGLDRVIRRALAKTPGDRFATAGDLAAAAAAALRTRRAQGEPASVSPPAPEGSGPRLGAVFGLASMAVVFAQSYIQITFDYFPPGADATGAELVTFYSTVRGTQLIGTCVAAVGFALLIGFVWSLPQMVGGGAKMPRALSAAVWIAGSGAVGTQLTGELCAAAPTFRLATIGEAELLQGLWTAYIRLSAIGVGLLGLTAAGVALIAFCGRGPRSVTAWSSLLVAAVAIAAVPAELGRDDNARFAAQAVISLWIAGVAVAHLTSEVSIDRLGPAARRRRIAAAGGLGPVVAYTVMFAIPVSEATLALQDDSSGVDFARFFQEATFHVLAYGAIDSLGFLVAVGLLLTLYRVLIPARVWAMVGLGAGVTFTVMTVLSQALYVLQTLPISLALGGSINALVAFTAMLSFVFAAVASACFSVAALWRRRLPGWLGWCGAAVSVTLLVASIAGLAVGEYVPILHDVAGAAFILWNAAAAVVLMSRPHLLVDAPIAAT